MTVSFSPFTTSRNAHGTYSLTLTQITSVLLNEIESLLGPRDAGYTYVGLEIDTTRDSSPTLWFPHVGHPVRDKERPSRHIIIRLTERAQDDANLAIWQLAHECVHLIDPWNIETESRQRNVLEEGLASWYQNTIVQGVSLDNDSSYEQSRSLIEPYMPELAATVKHIRAEHKIRISAIDDPELLLRHCPEMDADVAEKLCQFFPLP